MVLILAGVLGLLWAAGYGSLAVLLGALVFGYLGWCTVKPRSRCWTCRGTGRLWGAGSATFAQCPVCKGRKQRVRPGALIWRRNRFLYRDDPDAAEPDRITGHDRGLW